MTILFNANPRSAYLAGFFHGTHTLADLLAQGDFGLGALDRNDGELVVLDGRGYRAAEDGTTAELPPDATTPYAAVLPFTAADGFDVAETTVQAFERQVAAHLPLDNRIWALRIDGRFDWVTAGAGEPQHEPYRPMSEVFGEYSWIRHEQTSGTLVAFACPPVLDGINLVGFHYHWLSDDHRQGGHVADFSLVRARVEAAEATRCVVDIPMPARARSTTSSAPTPAPATAR